MVWLLGLWSHCGMVGQTGIPSAPGVPFVSTGPQGHRGRMRARLLANGPAGLADYELLEMLLFLSIPRRDTKPLAKAVINRFGSLQRSLTAIPGDLHDAGLDTATVGVFELVCESARRLTLADARSRPLLNDMARLVEYLDLPVRLQRPPHLAALLLNNRNQLLLDLMCTEAQAPADIGQLVAKRAIGVHATALILATLRPGARPTPGARDLAVTASIMQGARVLSIAVHDHWLFGAGETVSLKRLGLL